VEALSIQACNTSFGASPELAATIFPFPSKILIYSQPNRQKLRNIERNPRVGLNLNSKARGGDVARVEGVAEIAREAPPATEVPEYVDK